MNTRVFVLAKDLGIESKVLIEHMGRYGIQVKNSALAPISPEERDFFLDQFGRTAIQRIESAEKRNETKLLLGGLSLTRIPLEVRFTSFDSISFAPNSITKIGREGIESLRSSCTF